MKNRSQPFRCEIAGSTVGITLRHGGGLQEPESVYVRCDERECQYADLNTPPCPLRIDMFADGSDRRVAEYLAAHADAHVCYACLTDELQITHDQVRRATWRLKDEFGVAISPSRCVSCRRRRVTISLASGITLAPLTEMPAAVASPPAERAVTPRALDAHLRARTGYFFCAHCLARELGVTPAAAREAMAEVERDPSFAIRTAQCVSCELTKRVIRHVDATEGIDGARGVVQALIQSGGAAFCPSCLAFAADLPLDDVRRTLQMLEAVPEFERREGPCHTCGRWQAVISLSAQDADLARVAEPRDTTAVLVHDRNCRVDLLSFRVGDGWRPFALVKTALGALVPDAPALLLGLMPSKAEADELAASQARAWIDKRFS